MAQRYKLALEYVHCRTYGHGWEWFTPLGKQPAWGTWLALRCVRCGTERFDTVGVYGQLESRRYVYPEGYQMAQDERPDRDSFRAELLERLRSEAMQRMRARPARANRRRMTA